MAKYQVTHTESGTQLNTPGIEITKDDSSNWTVKRYVTAANANHTDRITIEQTDAETITIRTYDANDTEVLPATVIKIIKNAESDITIKKIENGTEGTPDALFEFDPYAGNKKQISISENGGAARLSAIEIVDNAGQYDVKLYAAPADANPELRYDVAQTTATKLTVQQYDENDVEVLPSTTVESTRSGDSTTVVKIQTGTTEVPDVEFVHAPYSPPAGGWDFTYDKTTDDSYQTFAAVDSIVTGIRAGKTTPATTHPRIFISDAASKTAMVARVADTPNLAARWQPTLDSIDTGWGVTIASTGGGSNTANPTSRYALMCAAIYQLGQANMTGPNYNSHTDSEYGDEAKRYLLDFVNNWEMGWGTIHYTWPLVFDWVWDKLSAGERTTCENWFFAQVDDNVPGTLTGLPGYHLLGLMVSDNTAHHTRAEADFYGGAVFGDMQTFYNTYGGVVGQNWNLHAQQMLNKNGPLNQGWLYNHYIGAEGIFLSAWAEQYNEDYRGMLTGVMRSWLQACHHKYNVLAYTSQETMANYPFQPYAWTSTNANDYLTAWALMVADADPVLAGWLKNETETYDPNGQYIANLPELQVLYPLLRPTNADAPLKTWAETIDLNYFQDAPCLISIREGVANQDQTFVRILGSRFCRRDEGAVGEICVWHNNAEILGHRGAAHDYMGGNRTNTPSLYDSTNWPDYEFHPKAVMDDAASRLNFSIGDSYSELTSSHPDYKPGILYYARKSTLHYAHFSYTGGWDGTNGALYGDNITSNDINGNWVRKIWYFPAHKLMVVHDNIDTLAATVVGRLNWQSFAEPSYPDADTIMSTLTYNLGATWGTGHSRYFATALEPGVYTLTKIGGHYQAPNAKQNGGTTVSGTASTISNTVSFYNNTLAGLKIEIKSGTGAGQIRDIVSNTTGPPSVITVTPDWDTIPDATSITDIGGTANGTDKQTPYQDIYGNFRSARQQVLEGLGPSDVGNLLNGMFRTDVVRTPVGNVYDYWFAFEFCDSTQGTKKSVSINAGKDQVTFDGNVLDLEEYAG